MQEAASDFAEQKAASEITAFLQAAVSIVNLGHTHMHSFSHPINHLRECPPKNHLYIHLPLLLVRIMH